MAPGEAVGGGGTRFKCSWPWGLRPHTLAWGSALACLLSDPRRGFSPAPRWEAGWLTSTYRGGDMAALGTQGPFPSFSKMTFPVSAPATSL